MVRADRLLRDICKCQAFAIDQDVAHPSSDPRIQRDAIVSKDMHACLLAPQGRPWDGGLHSVGTPAPRFRLSGPDTGDTGLKEFFFGLRCVTERNEKNMDHENRNFIKRRASTRNSP